MMPYQKFSKEDLEFIDMQIAIYRERKGFGTSKQAGRRRRRSRYLSKYDGWREWSADRFVAYVRTMAAHVPKLKEYVKDYERWFKSQTAWNRNRGIIDTDSLQSISRHFDNALEWIWPITLYCMEYKSLTNKQKKFCTEVSKRLNLGPGNMGFRGSWTKQLQSKYLWALKWLDEIEQFSQAGKFRDIAVGNSDSFLVDGITVHNAIGASDERLRMVKKEIEKATRLIKGGNYAPMKKALYGDAYLVSSVSGHNVLGFYNTGTDRVNVRLFERGRRGMSNTRTGYVHVLIHELGHRCWRKFVPEDVKKDWLLWFRTIDNQRASYKWPPEVGDVLPWTTEDGSQVKVLKIIHQRSGWFYVTAVTSSGGNRGWPSASLKGELEKATKFPTRYSSTNKEEFFCEAIASYIRGDLQSKFVDKLKSTLKISGGTPDVVAVQGDEEKEQLAQKVDLEDIMIKKIKEHICSKRTGIDGRKVTEIALLKMLFSMGSNVLFENVAYIFRDKCEGDKKRFTKLLNRALEQGIQRGEFSKLDKEIYIQDIQPEEQSNFDAIVKKALGRTLNDFFQKAKASRTKTQNAGISEITAETIKRIGPGVSDSTAVERIVSEAMEKVGKSKAYLRHLSTLAANHTYLKVTVFGSGNIFKFHSKQPAQVQPDPEPAPVTQPPQRRTRVKFPALSATQTAIMEALGRIYNETRSIQLSAVDVVKRFLKKDPSSKASKKGVGRSMGYFVRAGLLETNGKTPAGTLYKFTPLGLKWVQGNIGTGTPTPTPQPKPTPKPTPPPTPEPEVSQPKVSFPDVTETMRILLLFVGQNPQQEVSADSLRVKVNKYPGMNVTTKGLGRTMGALVRYGYLEKTGTSPSGTVYKGTNLTVQWFAANAPAAVEQALTALGRQVLSQMAMAPKKPNSSEGVFKILKGKGLIGETSIRGVGRAFGKLLKEGFVTREGKNYRITEKGKNWYEGYLLREASLKKVVSHYLSQSRKGAKGWQVTGNNLIDPDGSKCSLDSETVLMLDNGRDQGGAYIDSDGSIYFYNDRFDDNFKTIADLAKYLSQEGYAHIGYERL